MWVGDSIAEAEIGIAGSLICDNPGAAALTEAVFWLRRDAAETDLRSTGAKVPGPPAIRAPA
jgi:hypothetical protein